MVGEKLFPSFFMGGFECSTHRPHHGRRLDLLAGTAHDRFAAKDYARMKDMGLNVARDGIRWHLIEQIPWHYDFSSVLPMLRAAREQKMKMIWDLCHYGWPDDIDIFSVEFVKRYAGLCRAFAQVLAEESDEVPFFTPINEISFFAWAGGTVGYINPRLEGKGDELKEQLVRAAIEGIEAIWSIHPGARIVHPDPIINISAHPDRPEDRHEAKLYSTSQFGAWDMLCGKTQPHLGGAMKYLDIIGMNYYPHNQWVFSDLAFNPEYAIPPSHPQYRPLRYIVRDVYNRYKRPLFIAETGSDGDKRPGWLRYIGAEVRAAMRLGVPIEGICLYPIVNFPWWDNEFLLSNGLWGPCDEHGEREMYEPLARELRRQQQLFERYFPLSKEPDSEVAA